MQRNSEWLESLNIGTIMYMKPLKYNEYEYAVKKEIITEITKESLQEIVSSTFFTRATEMRFLEIGENKEGNKKAHKDI